MSFESPRADASFGGWAACLSVSHQEYSARPLNTVAGRRIAERSPIRSMKKVSHIRFQLLRVAMPNQCYADDHYQLAMLLPLRKLADAYLLYVLPPYIEPPTVLSMNMPFLPLYSVLCISLCMYTHPCHHLIRSTLLLTSLSDGSYTAASSHFFPIYPFIHSPPVKACIFTFRHTCSLSSAPLAAFTYMGVCILCSYSSIFLSDCVWTMLGALAARRYHPMRGLSNKGDAKISSRN